MGYVFDYVERQALLEIDDDPPMADAALIESLATHAHASLDRVDFERAASHCGMQIVVTSKVPHGIEGFLLGAERNRPIAVLRAAREIRRRNLALVHELAHWLLIRDGVAHSHGDVWCLTLALAFPQSVLRSLRRSGELNVGGLHWTCELPTWAARLRLQMPGVIAVFGENDMILS